MILQFILITLLSSYAPAQSGSEPEAGPQPIHVPDKFMNLRVLPPNISREHLISLMNGYCRQLGVRCSNCHMLNHDTHVANFASDIKPEKQTARVMIGMTQAINSRYLIKVPESLKAPRTVTCNTCHRGHAVPVEDRPEVSATP